MRGKQEKQITMLSALTPEQLVPHDHPIRRIKPIVDQALKELSPIFNRMYADLGRPSIPPEHLLKASLLLALYSIRSERQFCERLQYDLLFKWFLAIPHLAILGVFVGGGYNAAGETRCACGGLLWILIVIVAVLLLFTGKYHKDIFKLIMGINRWGYRVLAYVGLMTDRYPPFRLWE